MIETHEINMECINSYKDWLVECEKSANTMQKYLRDVLAFYHFASEERCSDSVPVDKALVLSYKEHLKYSYATASTNSILVAVNGFLQYIGREDCCVKLLKFQRRLYCEESREMSREEYARLVKAAANKGNERLALVLETICATGIRVSELRYITREAVLQGRAQIDCKGKRRTVFLPRELCQKLRQYLRERGNPSGTVFRTKKGNPLDRSNIWHDMKKLCEEAGVAPSKVFPHNLRHLFARIFYSVDKDIAQLADVLGHSSIDTTRIYIASTGAEHERKIGLLKLVI